MQGPTRDIGGDKVWVGKNARAWHRELEGRHKKLGEEVGKPLPIVDAAIRNEPGPSGRSPAVPEGRLTRRSAYTYHQCTGPRRDGPEVPVH